MSQGGWQRIFRSKEFLLLAATAIVIALTTWLDSQHTYQHSPRESAVDIARQISLLGIATLGVTVVIISGGIDLSIGAMIAMSGAVCGSIMVLLAPEIMNGTAPLVNGQPAVLPYWVIATGIAGSVLAGLIVGSLHAWLITSIGLPPFIATLATLVGLRSVARLLVETVTSAQFGSRAMTIYFSDPNFLYLKQVWIPFSVFVLAAVVVWVLLSKTVVGRHIYALGGNEQAAKLSGIRTTNVKWLAYCLSAVLAATAGVFEAAQVSTAEPQNAGLTQELNAIAASVVGGCSLQGGVGSVPGAALGVIFMRCVLDGIEKVIKSGSEIYQGLVVGVVVVVAVAFSQAGALRRKQVFPGTLGLAAIVTLSLLGTCLGYVIGGANVGIGLAIGLPLVLVAAKLWQSREFR